MRFRVENMTCGHCERTIRRALTALSPGAKITIDLRGKTVDVEGPLTAVQIIAALAAENYPAVCIDDAA